MTGDTATFWYATPDVVAAWGGKVLRDVDITAVQVRHAPGMEISELGPLPEGGLVLGPELDKWLGVSK